jgi:integrase
MLFTVYETAEKLRLHPNTLRNKIQTEEIRHIKQGGRYYLTDVQVKDYLDKRTVSPKPITIPFPLLTNHDKLSGKGEGESMSKTRRTRYNFGFGAIYSRKMRGKKNQGKSRWYLDYYVIEDGRKKRIQKVAQYATTKEEAAMILKLTTDREIKKQFGIPDKEKILFKDFARHHYLETYAKAQKASWKSDQKYLEAQLIPYFGKMYLSEITSRHVQEFVAKRQKDTVKTRHNGKVKGSSINRELAVLKKALNLAIEWNFDIQKNPVQKSIFFDESKFQRNRILTKDEEERLLNEAAPHLRSILICALNSGMRYNEILTLKWDDVDLNDGKITVKAEVSKSGKSRIIPISPMLMNELKRLKEQNGYCRHVFTYQDLKTKKFRPVNNIHRAFWKACKRANITDLKFHDLRHCFATRLARNSGDLVSVQSILGHASLKITQKYLHTDFMRKKEAIESLNLQ